MYACHIGLIRAVRPAQHGVILPRIRVNNPLKKKTMPYVLLISTPLPCPRCNTQYVENKTQQYAVKARQHPLRICCAGMLSKHIQSPSFT